MSKMVDNYLDLLQKIEKRLSEEELDPFLKEFAGIVNSGKNEDIRSIYNPDE